MSSSANRLTNSISVTRMSRNIKDIITSTKFVAAAVVSKVTLITAAKRYGGTGRYTEGNQLSECKKIFNAIFLPSE
jgi:hypothetical protein